MATDPSRLEIERWFRRRGVPHFIAGYSAAEDIFTRAMPLLVVVFLFEVLVAADTEWPWWGNTLALAGAMALLLGAWALVNRARGRQPLGLPTRVGTVELGVFVAVPALLPVVFGGDLGAAAATVGANLSVLAVVYVTTSYALLPLGRWALAQAVRSLGRTLALFARALPILLLFFLFLFINAEAWQTAGTVEVEFLVAALGLFLTMGILFLVARMPDEIRALARFLDPGDIRSLVAGTPADSIAERAPASPAPLQRREWANVGLVVLFGLGLQILVVSMLLAVFFVVLGLLVVRPDTIASWTGGAASFWGPQFGMFGIDVRLTRELLQVSSFLAGFSGMYLSVYAMTDPALRDEFYETVASEVRTSLAVRAIYRAEAGDAA